MLFTEQLLISKVEANSDAMQRNSGSEHWKSQKHAKPPNRINRNATKEHTDLEQRDAL
jgi:hypothetical protein